MSKKLSTKKSLDSVLFLFSTDPETKNQLRNIKNLTLKEKDALYATLATNRELLRARTSSSTISSSRTLSRPFRSSSTLLSSSPLITVGKSRCSTTFRASSTLRLRSVFVAIPVTQR